MNRETLLSLYDRLTKLVEKLPGGLQKPILRELVPIRELFLEQRPARILLLGAAGKSVPEFLHSIAGIGVETGESDNGWRTYRVPDFGEILVLDAREDAPQGAFDSALLRFVPDVALLLREAEDNQTALDLAAARLSACPKETPLIGIAFGRRELTGTSCGSLERKARVFYSPHDCLRTGRGRFRPGRNFCGTAACGQARICATFGR